VTAVQIPVAVPVTVAGPLIRRLPSTSTGGESGPSMLLGFLVGLIGVLAIFVTWKSAATR
jgi:hypothetical protein